MSKNDITILHERLEEKFIGAMEIAAKAISLKLEPEEIRVGFEFFVIPHDKDVVFVPTGTTKSPAGVSVTTADYILFMNKKDASFVVKSKQELLDYMRTNWANLKKELDSEYKTNGVLLNVNEI